jgi:predicted transcriptional regulator of viral defense system
MKSHLFFFGHPVFRHGEFAAWKTSQGNIKSTSVNTALRYYIQSQKIKRIRRELYAVIPSNQTPKNVTIDPYLIAAKATKDAVLGYHTALELMGAAYSTFGQFTYLTLEKSKPFEFQNLRFQPVTPPAVLSKTQKAFMGIDHIHRQGILITVTNAARTFVDILDRIELCGGWEEVCRSIQHFSVLNIKEVITYCLLLKNKRLNATVGYFLSQRKGAFMVRENQLQPLLNAVPTIPQYASKKTNEPFKLVKPWNILLPLSVIHQSWEEPNVYL